MPFQDQLWFIFNLLLFLIFSYLSVIIHELGHLLAAKAAHINVTLIQAGSGKKLIESSLLGTVVSIHANLGKGGITRIGSSQKKPSRLGFMLFFSGGLLVHVIILSLTLLTGLNPIGFFQNPAPLEALGLLRF
jgi:hypothetical protein